MLILLFQIGENHYAIETDRVIEIIPVVQLRKIPAAPAHIAGVFDYRGDLIPVIDLCEAVQGTSCQICYSTRIVIVNCRSQSDRSGVGIDPSKEGAEIQPFYVIGLMAEGVTETLKVSSVDLRKIQKISEAPYLGELFIVDQTIIQLIHWQYFVAEVQNVGLFVGGDLNANGAGRN